MSTACQCPERKVTLSARKWVVLRRNRHYSTFSKLRHCGGEYSDYSLCKCLACGALWSTKASYVSALPDIKRN